MGARTTVFLTALLVLTACPRNGGDIEDGLFPQPIVDALPPGYGDELPPEAEYPCVVKRVDGICPSTSVFSVERYEVEIPDRPPPWLPGDARYPELLSEALGFTAPVLLEVIRGETKAYGTGMVTEVRARYAYPEVTTRALYAEHTDAREAVVVVHGLGSSPDKVMGLDHEDYMRRIGQVLFDRGRDVVALDVTTNAAHSTATNARLLFYGTTIHGLATRTLCDMAERLKLRERYDKVAVYGLSNGAYISLYAGVLCEPFSLVIVDDGGKHWRGTLWESPDRLQSDLKYGMFIRYRRPLYEESSIAGPLKHIRSPLAWIAYERDFDAWRGALDGVDNEKVRFVFKTRNMHVPETDRLIFPLLAGRADTLDGYTLH